MAFEVLLMETGDDLLLENGDQILLESSDAEESGGGAGEVDGLLASPGWMGDPASMGM